MKLLPRALALLATASLLASCGPRPQAQHSPDDDDAARKTEERQAQEERAIHEKQAELDERERLLAEREKGLKPAGDTDLPKAVEDDSQLPPAAAPDAGQPRLAPQPPAESTDASYQTFFDTLAPYGVWFQTPQYGYVWQPRATLEDSRWRPYTVGRWAFTNAGWTFISDEPFGWVTYHYGRWMRLRDAGWVWVPGDLWAPAWVAWRFGNDYVGWAPLPPEAEFGKGAIDQYADEHYHLGPDDYTFVPASEFGDENLAQAETPQAQEEAIYEASNNMTQIVYDTNISSIVVYGPSYDYMRSKCRRPLPPPLKIQRHGYGDRDKDERAEIAGGTLRVTAPRIVRTTAAAMPRQVRGRLNEGRVAPVSARAGQPVTSVPASGMQFPSQMHPIPIPAASSRQPVAQPPLLQEPPRPSAPAGGPPQQPTPRQPGTGLPPSIPSPTGMRIPSAMHPIPMTPEAAERKQQDLERIERARAAGAESRLKAQLEAQAQEHAQAEGHAQAEAQSRERAAAERAAEAQSRPRTQTPQPVPQGLPQASPRP